MTLFEAVLHSLRLGRAHEGREENLRFPTVERIGNFVSDVSLTAHT